MSANKKEAEPIPIINSNNPRITIEIVNQGKECWYKNEKHYLVYESDDFKLISKSKKLNKAFAVSPNLVKYVKRKKN